MHKFDKITQDLMAFVTTQYMCLVLDAERNFQQWLKDNNFIGWFKFDEYSWISRFVVPGICEVTMHSGGQIYGFIESVKKEKEIDYLSITRSMF